MPVDGPDLSAVLTCRPLMEQLSLAAHEIGPHIALT